MMWANDLVMKLELCPHVHNSKFIHFEKHLHPHENTTNDLKPAHKAAGGDLTLKMLAITSHGVAVAQVTGRLLVRSQSAPVCMPNVPGQDTNPRLLSDAFIGV